MNNKEENHIQTEENEEIKHEEILINDEKKVDEVEPTTHNDNNEQVIIESVTHDNVDIITEVNDNKEQPSEPDAA